MVAVDDWIPSSDGVSPSYARPGKDGSFWAMIFEKAYAKIYSNYMDI